MRREETLSNQEAEAITRRVFAVAELLAKGMSKPSEGEIQQSVNNEKHEIKNVLYCGSERTINQGRDV
jgi:hypothetical protein